MSDDDVERVRDIYAEGVATRNATFETNAHTAHSTRSTDSLDGSPTSGSSAKRSPV